MEGKGLLEGERGDIRRFFICREGCQTRGFWTKELWKALPPPPAKKGERKMNQETERRLIVPKNNRYYTKTHEWVSRDDKNSVTVGITYYAQDSLGEIVSWKLPKKGQFFEKNQTFGWVESNKSVSDVYMPVSGEILEINAALTPGLISDSPMDKGWLIRVEIVKEAELAALLNPPHYKKILEKEIRNLEQPSP